MKLVKNHVKTLQKMRTNKLSTNLNRLNSFKFFWNSLGSFGIYLKSLESFRSYWDLLGQILKFLVIYNLFIENWEIKKASQIQKIQQDAFEILEHINHFQSLENKRQPCYWFFSKIPQFLVNFSKKTSNFCLFWRFMQGTHFFGHG